MEQIKILHPHCVSFKPVPSSHPAFGGGILIRTLGNAVELYAQVTLTASVLAGAKIAELPAAALIGVASVYPVSGEMLRYTSAADTTPDVRRCLLKQDGFLYNASGFALSAGQIVILKLTLITGT